MVRLPQPGGDTNTWGDILNDFLGVVHSDDGTLKGGIVGNTQVSALSQSKITGLSADLAAKADKVGAKFSRSIAILDPTITNVAIWRAQFPCRITAVLGYRGGGLGATINARKNGSGVHLSSDLSLSVAGSWLAGGAIQQSDYAVGDSLEVMVTGVSGAGMQLIIQIDFETL